MSVNKLYTLVFIRNSNKILLGYKTRGLGKGLWNGFGGKVEKNETIIDGAKRELKEECNLECHNLNQIGVVKYDIINHESTDIVHIFTSNQFEGNAKPSEEMDPIKWYEVEKIPYDRMWKDAKLWYPFMLKNVNFSAYFLYGQHDNILTSEIHQIIDE